jgi:energy-coupling factor transporter ATP-binding protein EcfA2
VAYVTHDQSEALAVSDQIIVMDQGLIAQRGTPQELYEYPPASSWPASWARPCCSRAGADGCAGALGAEVGLTLADHGVSVVKAA